MLRYPKDLKRLCFFVLLSATLLAGCVFKSDEEYFNDLEIPDPAKVGISITTLDLAQYDPGDTIDLYGSVLFNYSLSGTHGNIETANVYLADERGGWKLVTSGNSVPIAIDKNYLRSGTFGLMLDLTMRSGSGSLADKIEIEQLKVIKKWVLRVDLSLPPKPVPVVDIQEGFLTVQWPAYTKPNFRSYLIKRTSPSGTSKTFEIKDKTINSWKDENYVGGYKSATEYAVAIVSEVGTTTSAAIPRTDPMTVDFSFNPQDSIITMKWRRTRFYGTFKDYLLSVTSVSNGPTVTNINDTTLAYKYSAIRFGSEYSASLLVRSKTEGIPNYATLGGICKLGTPLPFKPVGRIAFNTYLNTLVAVDENKNLLELDAEFKPVRTIATLRGTTDWKMPHTGRYVYSYEPSSVSNNIYRLDLANNSEVSYEYSYLHSSNASHSVASNGLICIDYVRPRVSATRPTLYATLVFDPADQFTKYVYDKQSNTVNLSAVLSGDGRFVWANESEIYKISGGQSTLIGSLKDKGSYLGFRPDDNDEVMFLDGDKLNFYNSNTLAFIRSMSAFAEGYHFTSYDTQNKNMLWTYGSGVRQVYIANIETGARKTIPISSSASSYDFNLVNGLLIYNDIYIKVK